MPRTPLTPPRFPSIAELAGLLLCAAALPVLGVPAADAPKPPVDTGLSQQLRQQIDSECYGFVDHDPGLVRGFPVDASFQLQRDGYPWARFTSTANLLVQSEDVWVGGAGLACGSAPPGGSVNLVVRRDKHIPTRSTLDLNEHGGWSLLHETSLLETDRVNWRVAVREERWRDVQGSRSHSTDLATQAGWQLADSTRLRLDLESRRTEGPSDVGWPAADGLVWPADRRQSIAQDWSRYEGRQLGSLLALEHAFNADTQLRVGWSRVRSTNSVNDLYIESVGAHQFEAVAYVYPDQRQTFDALHAELGQHFSALGAANQLSIGASDLKVSGPDQARPAQSLGAWQPGVSLAAPAALPATLARSLVSRESRLTLRHVVRWTGWHANVALVASRFHDDNGGASPSESTVSPTVSLAWLPSEAWQLQLTSGRGATGRQYASITSRTPQRIAQPGRSTEHELGLRWSQGAWGAGVGVFELTRPYRFEQQTVSVWRGRETHRGLEGTLRWKAADESASVVFTSQALRTQVTGTGDATLDDKKPPGVPGRRAKLYAESRLPRAPDWTLSLSGSAVSRRPTFDDNRVFAPGYAQADFGLQWQGQLGAAPVSVLLAVENLTNRQAWESVGGGVAYPLLPRSVGLTLVLSRL